jgi:hypothetical protein
VWFLLFLRLCFISLLVLLQKTGVVVSNKSRIEADLVIACLGFSCDDGVINGHYLLDSWFVDGEKGHRFWMCVGFFVLY